MAPLSSVPDVGLPVEVVDRGTKVDVSRYDDWAPWRGGNDNDGHDLGMVCTPGGVTNTILGFQDFGTATRDYGVWIAVG